MLSKNPKSLRIDEDFKINSKTGIYDWVGTGACPGIEKIVLKFKPKGPSIFMLFKFNFRS